MNPEVKKTWVTALRSGDYTQGVAALRSNEDKFCCLGVLCDLHSKEFSIKWDPSVDHKADRGYLNCVSLLPEEVMKWAGLLVMDGAYVVGPKGLQPLPGLNDTGSTFEEIANLIEKQL